MEYRSCNYPSSIRPDRLRKRPSCAALFSNDSAAKIRLARRLEDQISEEPVVGHSEDLATAADQPKADEAAQRYRWLMDHSPLAIGVHLDGRYVYVNKTLVRKMAAQSADQFIGRRVTDFVHPDSLAAVHARIAEGSTNGTRCHPWNWSSYCSTEQPARLKRSQPGRSGRASPLTMWFSGT
ncbi:MAG: PAS domain S-box protein [Mycobacterium sp.]